MAERLLWLVHAGTRGLRDLVFGDATSLSHPEAVEPWAGRPVSWVIGPEPACTQTAAQLLVDARVDPNLIGLDVGSWRGRTFAEVMEEAPEDLARWLADADAAPHGGESLADLVRRVGAYCDDGSWPDGTTALLVTPLVARAAAVHALGVTASAIFRIDLAPLQRVIVSRSGPGWRVQHLG